MGDKMDKPQDLICFKDNIVELRRFSYPGAFYAYILDSFYLDDYIVKPYDYEKCKRIFVQRNKNRLNFME